MTIGEFFGTLQDSITKEWREHLKTDKYSNHMCLNDFYEEMPEKVDALIEAWQADNDIVDDYKNVLDEDLDALQYMEALKQHTLDGRELMTSPELESLCDDILSLIDSTIYKLKHLKESFRSLSSFLNEALNESLLDADFDIKDVDVILDMIHEYCGQLHPSGGTLNITMHHRFGNVNAEWYDEWVMKFMKAVRTLFKHCSSTKAKKEWETSAFIIIKRGKIEKFYRGHDNVLVRMPQPLEQARLSYICGVDIASCPRFSVTPNAKSDLSTRGFAGVDIYPIPVELATEICRICDSEFPR